MGAENVERLGENVIVDETGVDGEATHHGNYVTTSKKDLEDLRTLSLRLQHSLLQIRLIVKRRTSLITLVIFRIDSCLEDHEGAGQ